MDIHTDHIKTQKTTRYVTYGNLTPSTTYFWLVLHGSKMRCEQALYKFSEFDPETHFVVAPEGLHRQYLDGFGGEVVASWMTTRDRLHEIEDISHYLSKLYAKFTDKLPASCKKIILGFSQGGTMMFRWLHNTVVDVDFTINYSGWIPEDIDLTRSKTNLNSLPKIFTYGLQDQFLKPEIIKKVQDIIDRNDLDISIESYKGIHRMEKSQLDYLFKTYIKSISH